MSDKIDRVFLEFGDNGYYFKSSDLTTKNIKTAFEMGDDVVFMLISRKRNFVEFPDPKTGIYTVELEDYSVQVLNVPNQDTDSKSGQDDEETEDDSKRQSVLLKMTEGGAGTTKSYTVPGSASVTSTTVAISNASYYLKAMFDGTDSSHWRTDGVAESDINITFEGGAKRVESISVLSFYKTDYAVSVLTKENDWKQITEKAEDVENENKIEIDADCVAIKLNCKKGSGQSYIAIKSLRIYIVK